MVQNITPVNTDGVKSSSPGRLKEERTRLGLSQSALAESLGVTKWTVINYERPSGRGTPIPADSLSACARLGMDVQYILTGVPSANLNRVAEEAGAYRVEGRAKTAGKIPPTQAATAHARAGDRVCPGIHGIGGERKNGAAETARQTLRRKVGYFR
jgi:transcriptional regulator with XRE-family HTH domain